MDCSSTYTHTLLIVLLLQKNFYLEKYRFSFGTWFWLKNIKIPCLILNVKNIDISPCLYSGSYPYTLYFKSCLNILFFVFGEVWKISFGKNQVLEKYSFYFEPKFPSYKNSPNYL